MLRSSVAPRMNCSRQGGGIPRQPRAGDPAATRNGLHVRVHLRAAQPGSKLAHVGALPIAARPGTAVGGWTEVRVVNRYTRQFAGRTSTSRAGSSAASTSSPQAATPLSPRAAQRSSCHPSMKENRHDR
jgi:hypothetical protein